MPAFLVLPPDLTPTALMYRDDLPKDIDDVIEDCLERWRHGDINGAIRHAEEAQMLAEAYDDHLSTSVTSVLLTDLHREQDQLGLLPLGPQLRMKARDALRLQPGYEHRCHAEAVIDYLWGLLNHISGTNVGALSDYKRALASFESAVKHWNSNIAKNPTKIAKYKEQIVKCKKAIKWIRALRRCLVDDLSESRNRTEVHIPATDGKVYELVRFRLAAYTPPLVTYVRSKEIIINDEKYQLHRPDNGYAFGNNMEISWNERHFAVHVPEDQWAGQHSAQGDYTLVKREWQVTQPGDGVLWDDSQQEWKYGEFVRDLETEEIHFKPSPPPTVLGDNEVLEEDVKDKDIGSVCALLKPISAPPGPLAPPPPSPLADSTELYTQLVNMVGGDKGTADRLIEHERERTLDASRAELVKRAIIRLERDRR